MGVRKRTSWRVEDLAEWLSRYDEIHKAGTHRQPYNYETWMIIVKDVCLDYADYHYQNDIVKNHLIDVNDEEDANG